MINGWCAAPVLSSRACRGILAAQQRRTFSFCPTALPRFFVVRRNSLHVAAAQGATALYPLLSSSSPNQSLCFDLVRRTGGADMETASSRRNGASPVRHRAPLRMTSLDNSSLLTYHLHQGEKPPSDIRRRAVLLLCQITAKTSLCIPRSSC